MGERGHKGASGREEDVFASHPCQLQVQKGQMNLITLCGVQVSPPLNMH